MAFDRNNGRQTARFPDISLTFQSKQNSLTFPDFPQSGNPAYAAQQHSLKTNVSA